MDNAEFTVEDTAPSRPAVPRPAPRPAPPQSRLAVLRRRVNTVKARVLPFCPILRLVGFFGAVTGFAGVDALKNAVLDSVPAHTRDLNVKAFEAGFEYGKKLLESEVAEAAPAHA